ncbi:MAG: cutinase family protein [Actinomycetota bacterium]|nr:cutinase family protein [Actinomycetota bacterium]
MRSSCSVGIPRRLGLCASAVLVGSAPLVVVGVAPTASAGDCADAEVIFARGTDEPAGMGRVGDALVDSLRQQTGGLNIATYAVNYKATKLQLHGGDGAKDAISHVESTVSSCPNTKIVLGGYSQGASVIDIVAGVPIGGVNWGSALPIQYATNVAAVATFGDVADRAGGSLPTLSALLGSKAIDLCNPGDPICHAGPGNSWKGHTQGYVPEYTDQAATFVAAALLTGGDATSPGYGPRLPGYGPPPGPPPAYDPSAHVGPQVPGDGSEALVPDPQTTTPGPRVIGPGSSSPQLGLV